MYKYQHLVPKVYMKQWINTDGKIFVFEKDKYLLKGNEVSLDEFGGKDDYHTITFKSACRTEEHLERIENGEERILDVELGFNKFENDWGSIVKKIINNTSTKKNYIKNFDKEKILNFIINMWFRGYKGIENYREVINKAIDMCEKESYEEEKLISAKIYSLIYDEFVKDCLIGDLDKYIKEDDRSVIKNYVDYAIDNMAIVFLIAPDDISFISSDNPSFITEKDVLRGRNKGKSCYMPITPQITAVLAMDKNNDEKYKILKVKDYHVKAVNREILNNCKSYVMSRRMVLYDYFEHRALKDID